MNALHCRRAGFSLIELLVVISVIGILVALIIPAVGAVQANARKMAAASNLRQIALAYKNYSEAGGGRARTIPADTAGPHEWALVLAREVGFNDPAIYILEDDDAAAAVSSDFPRVVGAPSGTDGSGEWAVDANFAAYPLSFAVVAGLSTQAPANTPLAWTRGLGATDNTWDATNGVYGGDGGHVARLDGSVTFIRDTAEDGGVFVNPTNQTPTSNAQDALQPATARILQSSPGS